jgi:hypothetical protein
MKDFRLPKEFAEKWLKALRSGDYEQGTNALYKEKTNGYCCLGVACRIEYPLHYLLGSDGRYAGVIEKSLHQLKFNLKKIPKELIGGNLITNRLVNRLTRLNDDDKSSFKEIADWIEDNVELY